MRTTYDYDRWNEDINAERIYNLTAMSDFLERLKYQGFLDGHADDSEEPKNLIPISIASYEKGVR